MLSPTMKQTAFASSMVHGGGRGYPSDAIAPGLSSGVLVLVTDGYGPLIELVIGALSADSHFGT